MLCEKYDEIITYAGSGHHLRPDRIDRIIKEMPVSVASGTHYTHTHTHTYIYIYIYIYIYKTSRVLSEMKWY